MKKFALFSALLVVSFACQKEANEAVMPDISGIYQITTLRNVEGEILNFPTLAADGKVVVTSEVEVTKVDDYQINVLRKGVGYGRPYSDPLGQFDIRKDEDEYIVYKDGLYIGSLNGSKLYLNFAGRSNNRMIASIRATK